MADRWRTLATGYDTLAEALEGPPTRGHARQQPMQQQQQKTTEGEE